MTTPDHAPADPIDDGSDFVRKWRGAWPEWAIAEVFVPAAERTVAPFWQALQFELLEAAWGGPDARPGEAKLGWWMEELSGWSQGRRRHPLGVVLTRREAPWSDLARELPALAATRERPANVETAWASVAAPAGAASAVEAALLGGVADARMVAACWLHDRLARHPENAVPVEVDGVAAWAARLRGRWPAASGLAATRRLEAALALARLRSGDPGRPRGPLPTVWTCWRAARD